MDLRKLEALVAAVELGSFTKAAQQLGYKQCWSITLQHCFLGCQQSLAEFAPRTAQIKSKLFSPAASG